MLKSGTLQAAIPECLFNFSDPVCGRPRVRHRPGEDVQVLLPETQNEGHQLLPGRRVRGADRMAHRRSGAGILRFFPFVQVKHLAAASESRRCRIVIS